MSVTTLDNIKELRDVEKSIYGDLNQQSIDPTKQRKMVNKLERIGKVRTSLVDDLTRNYETSNSEMAQTRSDIDVLSNAVDNKQRMVEINTYYGKQYDAHRAVAMLLLYTFIVIFIVALFRNRGLLSANIANILVALVLLVGAVVIYFRVSDLSMRNNMDYDKYEWPSMPSDGKKLKDYVPPPPDPVGGESNCPKDPSSCVGEKCCGTGTTYDNDSKKCKTIVTTDVSTTESFVSMFRREHPDGVVPFSEPHNCASV